MENSNKKKKTPVLKRLMPYLGSKGYLLYIAMVLSALSGIMILMPMVHIHKIVSSILLNEQIDFVFIKRNAVFAALYAGGGILLYLVTLACSHIFAFEVEDNIVKLNVKKLMDKPLGYFVNKESGKIRNVIVDGAAETHSFLAHQLPDMAMTMITPIVLLVFFFVFDWKLGLVSMIPMLIGMVLMTAMMSKESKKMREDYFLSLSNLSAEAVEYVRCIPIVKTFAQSVESFEKLYSSIVRLKELVLEMTMMWKRKMSVYEAVIESTAFFLVPVAIMMISRGGDVREVAGNSVIYFLIGPALGIFIMRSATISQYTYFAELALDKIDNILEYEDFSYGDNEVGSDGLEFKDVSFSYGTEKILDHISFTVNHGETVALVGASSGGKTTIARLAARFYDVEDGEILFGGVNIKEYNKASLSNRVAFVFQNAKLFKMSLRENLLLGKEDATEKELEDALVRSGSQEIVERLEYGLDTVYGTKGTYFSGGEAQRLSIARAFLKNADLVILDEATAFSDPENEHIIQQSFKELSKDKTTLMIAHRLSTVVDADKILVIDQGKIVEQGKHSELLAKNGTYQKLWNEYQRSVNWKIGGHHG